LDAIESGNFSVPKDELEKSRRKMDEQAAERALMAERAKRNDTLYQTNCSNSGHGWLSMVPPMPLRRS
jgi:hypothetical protein